MTRLRTLSAIALSVALIPAGAAFAQSAGGGRDSAGAGGGFGTGESQPSGFSNRAAAQSVIDIEFGGGNLAEYFEHLQQRNGVRNIIMAYEQLTKFSMPEVKLTSVLFSDAVELSYFLAVPPDGLRSHIDTVGSNKSIYVVGVRDRDQATWVHPTHKKITFDFGGGSLTEFVQLLQEESGVQRVLVRGPADKFEIDPIKFEGVTFQSVLMAFAGSERRLESGQRLRLQVENREGIILVEVEAEEPSMVQQRNAELSTSSWSISTLRGAGGLSTEDILAAIEAAIEVSSTAGSTDLRFHEPSSLLVAAAPQSTLTLIDLTLDRLRETSDRLQVEYDRIRGWKADLVKAESEIEQLQSALDEAEARIDEAAGDPQRNHIVEIYHRKLDLLNSSLRETMAKADAIRYRLSNQD